MSDDDKAKTILKLLDLEVVLGGGRAVADVELLVKRGEFVAVIGPNGAGKTSLLRAAAGLVPARGTIEIAGDPLKKLSRAERARRLGYLPQGHVFHWPLPVGEIVALGRLPRGAGADLSAVDREAVVRAMTATGVLDYAERPVTTLSGGERARVALARVLATEAPLILADEPTAALDPRYQLIVLDILRKHAAAGGAVIAVLHDVGLAARQANRVVIMDVGRIVADGPPREVLTKSRLAETLASPLTSSRCSTRRSSCHGRLCDGTAGRRSHRPSASSSRTRGVEASPESNRGARICSPLRNHSATRPHADVTGSRNLEQAASQPASRLSCPIVLTGSRPIEEFSRPQAPCLVRAAACR